MKHVVVAVFISVALSACTSIQVEPLDKELAPAEICIERNSKVIVSDFLPVLQTRLQHHGVASTVSDSPDPKDCEYILTYVAYKTWDVATYLYSADLRLERRGIKVAEAQYRLKGRGGLSLMKWQSTQTKMEPVVDQLLGKG